MAKLRADAKLFVFTYLILLILYATRAVDDVEYIVVSKPSKLRNLPVIEASIFSAGSPRHRRAIDNTSSLPDDNSTIAVTEISTIIITERTTPTTTPSTTPTTQPSTTPTSPQPSTTPTSPRPPTTPGSTTPIPPIIEGSHSYYSSRIIQNDDTSYWQDLTSDSATPNSHVALKDSHRTAVTVDLTFDFPFYGHMITNVTIATGGFLYMSPFLHKYLTATQYIAPLMANFDLELGGNLSDILYMHKGDLFIVQWQNVQLHDQRSVGSFDFQVILYRNGNIAFVYKRLPIYLTQISESKHPVKIGLSDAFYYDTYVQEFDYTKRTIYEYHHVPVSLNRIINHTSVMFEPLPTCNTAKTCLTCSSDQIKFSCAWCNTVGRCSDGLDWHRQNWIEKGCRKENITTPEYCPTTSTLPAETSSLGIPDTTHPDNTQQITASHLSDFSDTVSQTSTATEISASSGHKATDCSSWLASGRKDSSGNVPTTNLAECKAGFPVGGVIALILIIMLLLGSIGGWFYYAYTHPTSKSGMCLMENRPSQMKSKLAKVKFWQHKTPTGENYKVESEA